MCVEPEMVKSVVIKCLQRVYKYIPDSSIYLLIDALFSCFKNHKIIRMNDFANNSQYSLAISTLCHIHLNEDWIETNDPNLTIP
jgi:hypothetical protein